MLRFRKEALAKNQSPEHFDDLLKVTRPSHWYMTGSVVVIVLAITAWSFLGQMNLKVRGEGIILNSSGLSEVRANFEGVIHDVAVQVGQHVTTGQIIANVSQPTLELEIKSLDERLERVKADYRLLDENSDPVVRQRNIALFRRILDTTTLNDFENVRVNNEWKNLSDLKANLLELQNYSEERRLQLFYEEQEVKAQLTEKRDEYRITGTIRSPYDGVVVELAISAGDVFTVSTTVCTIENDVAEDSELTGLIYVDATEAARLDPGMPVLLQPSNSSPEEDGYLEGYVYYVSKYPATRNGMNRALRNDKIVESLSENGLPLAVEVRFYPDSTTASGYSWSSGGGADVPFVSGTFSSAIFIIGTERPIDVFVPYLSSESR